MKVKLIKQLLFQGVDLVISLLYMPLKKLLKNLDFQKSISRLNYFNYARFYLLNAKQKKPEELAIQIAVKVEQQKLG